MHVVSLSRQERSGRITLSVVRPLLHLACDLAGEYERPPLHTLCNRCGGAVSETRRVPP